MRPPVECSAPGSCQTLESIGSSVKLTNIEISTAATMVRPNSWKNLPTMPPMLLGLSRKCATDYSFFLAIPTLVGAGLYSLYKERALLSAADIPLFGVGLLFSFLSAWVCVRWLLRYISTHTFVVFAWYRIAFGIVVLITAYSGLVTWAD